MAAKTSSLRGPVGLTDHYRLLVQMLARRKRFPQPTPCECSLTAKTQQRFQGCHYAGLRSIVTRVTSRGIELHGRVLSYYEKQVAQELIRGLAGSRMIINCIDVGAN